jgi:hypothetical protein
LRTAPVRHNNYHLLTWPYQATPADRASGQYDTIESCPRGVKLTRLVEAKKLGSPYFKN